MSRQQRLTGACLGLVCIAVACAVSGCGSGKGLVPVSGTVTFDGKPLNIGSVSFMPDTEKNNKSLDVAVGEVRDGKYELTTEPDKGAMPGAYIVIVESHDMMGEGVPDPGATKRMPVSKIPKKYTDASTTPLRKEVVAAPAAGQYDLTLTK